MDRGYKRRNLFVNKGFQARFIARFLSVSIFGGILAVASFNFLAYKRIDAILFSMKIPALNTGNVLFREAAYANGLAFVLVVIAYLLTARRIHSEMARSIHRIRADIQGLIRGDLGTRIQLEEDEDFRGLSDHLNLMAGELQRRFSDIKDHFERVDESVRELRDRPEGVDGILKEKILQRIAALEERLQEFRV